MFSQYLLFYMFLYVISCHIIKTNPLPTPYLLVLLENSLFCEVI